jgi:hypothetical protein
MIPKLAIEKAIEGGWEHSIGGVQLGIENGEAGHSLFEYAFVLDPNFWTCLGKSLGWKDTDSYDTAQGWRTVMRGKQEWVYHAYRFYDLTHQGKSTDEFWQEILAV